jgi:hypothetical protein
MNFAVIHQLGEVGSDHAPKFCDKYSLSLDKNVAIKQRWPRLLGQFFRFLSEVPAVVDRS